MNHVCEWKEEHITGKTPTSATVKNLCLHNMPHTYTFAFYIYIYFTYFYD